MKTRITIHDFLYAAMEKFPYYARGFSALTPICKEGLGTFAVDRYWRLYYSADALERYEMFGAAVVCHELEHLLREHDERRQTRVNRSWNVACDAEINDDIVNLPPTAVFPRSLDMAEHLTAEDYYVKVSDVQTGKHGSGTGDVGEWEEAPPQSSAEGIVDKSDADSLRDSIADDVAQHQAQWGNVPGGTLLWAQARAKGKLPRLDWRIKIRRRLREIVAGSSDFNAARLSRRQEPQERVLLSGKQSYIPKITVVVDTSGSMGAQGDWVAGCLRDINKMYKRTTLIDCDAAVHRIAKLKTWRDILKSLGGGGTDMRVGVAKAQELKADMIILLTDGETPWPSPWPANLVAVLPGGKVITNERVP